MTAATAYSESLWVSCVQDPLNKCRLSNINCIVSLYSPDTTLYSLRCQEFDISEGKDNLKDLSVRSVII